MFGDSACGFVDKSELSAIDRGDDISIFHPVQVKAETFSGKKADVGIGDLAIGGTDLVTV